MTAGTEFSATQLQRVETLCSLQRYAEAITLAGGVLATEPHNARAWCLMSRAQLGTSAFAEALNSAERAISLAPDLAWPHRLASIALSGLKRHETAVVAARQAVRLDPHDWRSYVGLAGVLRHKRSGRKEALRMAEHAVALAPDEAQTHLVLGQVALAARRRDEAEAAFRRALAIDPNSSAAHNELARVQLGRRGLLNGRRLATAGEGFATAVRADPRSSRSRNNVEVVLRVLLTRVAACLLLDGLVVHATSDQHAVMWRVLPIVLLVVPADLARRFVAGLSTTMRQYLLGLFRIRGLRMPLGLVAVALLCLLASAVAPLTLRDDFGGTAMASALIGEIVLIGGARELTRGRPMLGTAALWVVAGVCVLLAVGTLATLTAGRGATAVLVGVGFAALAAWAADTIRHRRSPGGSGEVR
jgi:tetratricopeptide (TPR) repeat protein